jgi:hypothetical protein
LDSVGGICPQGKIPVLMQENHETWGLFQEMFPGLIMQAGYDYNAIKVVMDIHGLGQTRRAELMALCVKMIGIISKARNEKVKK